MHPRRAPVLALLLLAPALTGCLGGAPDVDVLTTFYPLQFLTETIAGDNVTVGRLIPEGTEPHDWEPSPRDLRRIDRSSLVIAQGLGFEPWLDGAVDTLGAGAPTVVHTAEELEADDAPWGDHDHADASEDEVDHGVFADCGSSGPIGLPSCMLGRKGADQGEPDDHGHEHAEGDPHTWLDPVLFATQAARIRDTLAQTFPEHRDAFFTRAETLIHGLEVLHDEHEARLDSCVHQVIVVPHDAFSHLAGRYGFRVEAVTGLDPEAEPAARRVQEVIELIRQQSLPVIFAESGGDDRIMRSIAQESGAELRTIHTLEGRPAAAQAADTDHLDLMRENLDGLAAAMECTG